MNAGFPYKFIEYNINKFVKNSSNSSEFVNDDYIIPPWLFELPRKCIFIEIPYCHKNEAISHHFIQKLKEFTNDQYIFIIKWNTRRIKSLFSLKDRNVHPSCEIYQGTCVYGLSYIGETKRNVETRWSEHRNYKHKSEISQHLVTHDDHEFNFKVLSSAPSNTLLRKILEAFYIARLKPTLNDQLQSQTLKLFQFGITWIFFCLLYCV